MSAITGIDHTLVGVRDLEKARAAYARLGFTPCPRGSHIGWGTANYCLMFPNDYVEILGIVDPTQFTNNLDAFLAKREGLMGLAWATRDNNAVKAELERAGIAADGPKDLKRRLELPEGTVLPEFKLVYPSPGATPSLASFVCQHLTPALLRRPEWLAHANGAVGLGGITIAVANTDGLADAYGRLFGMGAVTRTDDTVAVRVGPHLVLFAPAESLDMLHPGVELPEKSELPMAAVMTVTVANLAATGTFLGGRNIPHDTVEGHTIMVPPDQACGVWLEFVVKK
ncbi:MAG: VOC family protein [Alphaproteobacteria bacterium]